MEKNNTGSKGVQRKYLILLFTFPIIVYSYTISPLLGPRCRFYPSCSVYSIAAIQNHGIIRGLFLMLKRLLKCHPWHSGGIDIVPESKKERNCP